MESLESHFGWRNARLRVNILLFWRNPLSMSELADINN